MGHLRTRPRVKRTAPRPQEMRELLAQLPAALWQRRVIKEGSKGPLVAEFAFLRVTPVRDELPGPRSWAIFRRTLGPQPEVKFYFSNAPVDCPRHEFVRVSGMRWPVETALGVGKSEVGMDHYETRTWRGWHHHMAHVILAFLFLLRLQLLFQKKPSADPRAGAPIDRTGHRRRNRTLARSTRDPSLSAAPQPRRVLFPPSAETFKGEQTAVKPAQRQSLVVIPEVS